MRQRESSAITIIILAVLCGTECNGQQKKDKLDRSKTVVILPFESTVTKASGLADATRTAVIQFLTDEKMFAAILTPEAARDKDRGSVLEIGAKLVDFGAGNMATRMVVGLGSGRAHAGFDFTVKDAATGNVLWQKTIKEKASFWSNSASSVAQRLELPEKLAKSFLRELNNAK